MNLRNAISMIALVRTVNCVWDIGVLICFIGILLFPMVGFTYEDGEKEGDPTPALTETEDEEIIIGYSKEMRRLVDKDDDTVIPMLIEALDLHRCLYVKEKMTFLDKKDNIITIILIGDADLHRYVPVDDVSVVIGMYMGFLKADKIMFVDDNVSGDRLLTVAVGNVEFLRGNIYITSHCAYQNHTNDQDRTENLITFEGDVKIADVIDSMEKVRKELVKNEFNLNLESEDAIKTYNSFKELSSKFLTQIDKDKEDHSIIWSSIFHYDSKTGNGIADGDVRFKIYRISSREEIENAENETDTSSSSDSNSSESEPQTEK